MPLVKISSQKDKDSIVFDDKETPKGGYWLVEWSKKPKGRHKEITCFMSKVEAQVLADVFNGLPQKIVCSIVDSLHHAGRRMQIYYERGARGEKFRQPHYSVVK